MSRRISTIILKAHWSKKDAYMMTTHPSPKPIIVLYHYTLQAKEGEERAPKYHTIIIWFMTCDSPLQKVSYGMYYCTQSAPLNTIIVPIKGAALSGLLPPHPVTPSGWLLSTKVIILMLLSVSACHPYSMFKLEPIKAANQQNYWLCLSPMSVMHITLRWQAKKERKELRSFVSYNNNDSWLVVLLWKS